MKPGLYPDIPFSEYLKIEAFSKSAIPHINRSPRHFLEWQKGDRPTSDAQRMGNLVECYLLESDKFKDQFINQPEFTERTDGTKKPFDYTTNHGRAWKKKQAEEGKEVVLYSEIYVAGKIVESIMDHKTARQWLDDMKGIQLTMIWEDPETGVLCKGRIDFYTNYMLVDLKTTKDASLEGFAYEMSNWGYHQQAAFYSDGWAYLHAGQILPFGFIAAENVPPYACAAYMTLEESLLTGQIQYKKAIRKYADWKRSGTNYAYSDLAVGINIPAYKFELESEEKDGIGI